MFFFFFLFILIYYTTRQANALGYNKAFMILRIFLFIDSPISITYRFSFLLFVNDNIEVRIIFDGLLFFMEIPKKYKYVSIFLKCQHFTSIWPSQVIVNQLRSPSSADILLAGELRPIWTPYWVIEIIILINFY